MKPFSRWLLSLTENLFLRAHGWTKLHDDWWVRPETYDQNRNGGEPYRQGHAVNSQKWTNARDRRYAELKKAGVPFT